MQPAGNGVMPVRKKSFCFSKPASNRCFSNRFFFTGIPSFPTGCISLSHSGLVLRGKGLWYNKKLWNRKGVGREGVVGRNEKTLMNLLILY